MHLLVTSILRAFAWITTLEGSGVLVVERLREEKIMSERNKRAQNQRLWVKRALRATHMPVRVVEATINLYNHLLHCQH